MRTEVGAEIQSTAGKLAPVGAIVGAKVVGWGPAEWMYALTAAYVVLQALYLLWKWRNERAARREAHEAFLATMKLPPA